MLAGRLDPDLEELCRAHFRVIDPSGDRSQGPPLRGAAGGVSQVRALVTSGGQGASAAQIDSLPALEIIASFGVGVDSIDLEAARRRGVIVTNTPDVLSDAVADLAIGLLLAVSRRICQADRFVRAGQWPSGGFSLGRGLAGRRCGIVGMGAIGRCVATRALAFGLEVAYSGPHEKLGLPYRFYADLVELARASDFLILTLPGGSSTRGLIDASVLEALGREGVLINVARGSVVDEAALVRMLSSGELGGAGLDVFEHEPHAPPELFALENVVLLPHLGSATVETRLAMARLTFENLQAHFSGRPPLTPV